MWRGCRSKEVVYGMNQRFNNTPVVQRLLIQKIVFSATDRRKPDASRRLLASLSDVRCGIGSVLDVAARWLREWRNGWRWRSWSLERAFAVGMLLVRDVRIGWKLAVVWCVIEKVRGSENSDTLQGFAHNMRRA